MSSPVLDRQLLAYTLAGGAGMLAAGSADAAIIYSGLLNQSVTFGSSYTIDFNGGGTDLSFQIIANGNTFEAQVSALGNTTVVSDNASSWATNYASGVAIDGSAKYVANSTKLLAQYVDDGTFLGGNFTANATGFLGVRVDGTNYGWVQLAFGGPVDATTGFTVVDWAYDNTGATILAGDKGAAGAVPLPGAAALAALAVGASGLRGRRGRERAA